MGRLQTLSLGAALLVAATASGCDDKTKASGSPADKRSEAVLASGPVAKPSATPTQSAPPVPAKPRGPLCPAASLNRSMPTEKVSHAEAHGLPALGDTVAIASGKWTWINLWAAWCGPCKEEMPRLIAWQSKLAASMALQFVSLDDDERQLTRFLEAQPANSMRASYWLPEGNTRDNWLGALRLKNSPQLPVQILVNPQGKVHCIIEGAVEDSDFAQVAAIVGQK